MLEDESPVIYGLESMARSLCPMNGESETTCFIVGTQSLQSENQVHLIDFDDETNLTTKYCFVHSPGEIWFINSHPTDKNILATCYNHVTENSAELEASLWRIPPVDETEPPQVLSSSSRGSNGSSSQHMTSLQKLCDLKSVNKNLKRVLWSSSGDTARIVTLSDHHVEVWGLDASRCNAQTVSSAALEGRSQPLFTTGRFNPHHGGNHLATAYDCSVKGWDLRSMSSTFTIPHAHSQTVRDIDFNPNKQYYMVTCSDDCRLKFWDTRNTKEALLTRSDHSHWIWSVRYNHFHDQLILTSSSDSRVILSSIPTLSSEPFGHLGGDDDDDDNDDNDNEHNEDMQRNRTPAEDRVISQFDEHEDSVYAVEWSAADPWVFASLSYDGRLVINRVPRSEKYNILL